MDLQPLLVLNDFHYSPINTIAIDNNNKFFLTGGNDSLIGFWDMSEMMPVKTISNNDLKVMALNISHDSQYIASIFEDEISQRYTVEIYDAEVGNTLYNYQSSYMKICL